ncbi:HD-GYP domain-containing protein [Bacillus testis]|uniref:HD-GYP domain-containing protein n=1 Tax=Bacillus testis TaxID=1622072 RepID=UPI00067EED38|nr:HD-GYP domain-containing protein [Bacillus testis]
MRLISTEYLNPGNILGKTIYNGSKHVLLQEGIALNERMIARLKELGIPFVYIEDSLTEGIEAKSTISEQTRAESIATIQKAFMEIGEQESLINSSFVIEKAAKKLGALIRNIMSEIKSNDNLLTILSDMYIHDSYIFIHSFHVTLYSLAIGMQLNLSQKQLEILGMGSILHDVGKTKIPLDILLKPGRLTELEYEEIKKHAEHGFHILKKAGTVPLLVAHCAFQHHERLNGSGYPRGLIGSEIHYYGKIIAVADVFDAVTSNRVYRKAMLPHEGLEILYSGSGSLFDQKIVEAFRKSVAIYPIGLTVVLNDGRIGVVSRQNVGVSDRPVVRIIEENNKIVTEVYEVDLLKKMDVLIVDCDKTLLSK